MGVAILHEGKEIDREFIDLLINSLDPKPDKSLLSYYGFGSKSNFFDTSHNKYKDLKLEIANQSINKILFILDADNKKDDGKYGGYDNTKKELQHIIDELQLKSTDVYITKDPNKDYGNFESLILSTISKEQQNCINYFLKCSDFKDKKNTKAILNQIYKLAYPKHPYNFNHENFNPLKEKLKSLFK